MFALAFQYLAIVYLAIGKKIFHCGWSLSFFRRNASQWCQSGFRRKTTQLPPAPPTINPIYVVFRGRVPGVYTTEADLLRNITNLEGTHFASFVRPAEATSAWCDALANEKVHPIEETNPSPLRLWEDRPAYFNSVEIAASSGVPLDSVGVARRARRSAKSHISRLLELVLDSALEGPGPKLTSAELAQQEFHQPSNSEGAKWIVLQGRKPGIFDTWYAFLFLTDTSLITHLQGSRSCRSSRPHEPARNLPEIPKSCAGATCVGKARSKGLYSAYIW